MNRASFTLIELLIVIAIVTILAVVVVLVLNPAELLRQARDSNRLGDMTALNKAVAFFQVDVSSGFLGNSSTTYFSLIDPSATTTAGTHCQGVPLTPPFNWIYRCAASSTQRNVDGTGWMPVNFTQISSGAPLGILPIDPTNTSSSGYYYSYTPGGSWALSALLESQRYLKQSALNDGGYSPGRYEVGDTLSLVARSEGLVGWWDFEEGSDSTVRDRSGNGNNGTWNGTGARYTTGKVGVWAGQFATSTSDSVSVPDPPNGSLDFGSSQDFSVSSWAKTPDTSTYRSIFGKCGQSDTCPGYEFFIISTGLYFRLTWTGGPLFGIDTLGTLSNINDNNFHHIVGVVKRSSNLLYIYADGQLLASNNISSVTNLDNSGNFTIGTAGAGPYVGSIDDLRIYSRALSAKEIETMYNATR